MRPVTKQPIKQYDFNDYDVLRTHLFANVGAYCSYCEAPIGNDSAVEHKVPQSLPKGFPSRATQWRNLLIACQSCNSAKSAKPDRNEIQTSPPLKTEDWYMATLRLWVWPDSNDKVEPRLRATQPAPPVDEIYRLIRYERSNYSQDGLERKELVRKPSGVSTLSNVRTTKTWVTPNDAFIKDDKALRQRVLNTILGLNLNLHNTADPGYNDRRVDNRDEAYRAAQTALSHLEAVVMNSAAVTDDRVVMVVKSIREAALATGFWSVWFTLFRGALDNPFVGRWTQVPAADRQELLLRCLVYYYPDEQGNNRSVPLFPGTDVSRLHLNAFQ